MYLYNRTEIRNGGHRMAIFANSTGVFHGPSLGVFGAFPFTWNLEYDRIIYLDDKILCSFFGLFSFTFSYTSCVSLISSSVRSGEYKIRPTVAH